jgi:hypothetical protein
MPTLKGVRPARHATVTGTVPSRATLQRVLASVKAYGQVREALYFTLAHCSNDGILVRDSVFIFWTN